jgi:uncharacterized membrane protein YjjP (DUF1212 family)
MEILNGNINNYIVLVVLGICLCTGYIIKHLVPGEKINRYIPLIMGILGLIINVWINMAFTPDVVLGGLISGLASTGAHQAFTQILFKE